MVRSRAVLALILGATVAACATSPGPSEPQAEVPSSTAQITNPPDGPSPLAATAPPSAPSPTATSTPTQKASALPVPPKPSGVKLDFESEYICDAPSNPEFLCEVSGVMYTVSWKAPRATGVEIRAYGVTKCFSDDIHGAMIDGWCLREHVTLPKSELALLGKAPASKGKVTWRLKGAGYLDGNTVGDTYNPGDPFYSVVLAAYDADGEHSTFAIADVTHVCNIIESLECPDDPFWPGDD